MLDRALLLIVANHLRDIHNQLSSTILEAKSHRPSWRITKIRVKEITQDGGSVEKELEMVDKLDPLANLYSTLEKSATNYLTNPADS